MISQKKKCEACKLHVDSNDIFFLLCKNSLIKNGGNSMKISYFFAIQSLCGGNFDECQRYADLVNCDIYRLYCIEIDSSIRNRFSETKHIVHQMFKYIDRFTGKNVSFFGAPTIKRISRKFMFMFASSFALIIDILVAIFTHT